MALPPAVRLLRPGNLALAASGTVAGAALAAGGLPAQVDWRWPAAAAATAAVAAFGNVLNDLRDARVDRSAHPDRPLPQGYPRGKAWRLAAASLLLGLGLAAPLGLPAFLLAAANAVLLVAYELALKRLGLPGNVAVAALVGTTFAFGALATAGHLPARVLLAAALAALANLSRELLKDLQDADGDRGHRLTFPLRHGASATCWAALASTAVAVVLSGPLLALSAPSVGLALVVAADLGLLAACASAWSHPARSQKGLKLAMAVALLGFLLL